MSEIIEFSGISGIFDFVLLCLVFFKCRKKCRKKYGKNPNYKLSYIYVVILKASVLYIKLITS